MDNYTLCSAFEVDKHIDPVAEANKRYEENHYVRDGNNFCRKYPSHKSK